MGHRAIARGGNQPVCFLVVVYGHHHGLCRPMVALADQLDLRRCRLALAPANALLPIQMLALALTAATTARVARVTTSRSRAAAVKRHDSMQCPIIVARTGTVSLWFLSAVALITAAPNSQ